VEGGEELVRSGDPGLLGESKSCGNGAFRIGLPCGLECELGAF
jgi:hypothetical protein